MKKKWNNSAEKNGNYTGRMAGSLKDSFISEVFIPGCNLGIILFTGALFSFKLTGRTDGLSWFFNHMWVILLVYLGIGTLLQFTQYLPEINFGFFRGAAFISWIYILEFVLFLGVILIPGIYKSMAVSTLIVLAILWFAQYYSLSATAKLFNGGKRHRTLVVDLTEYPKSPEAFFQILEDYCIKNNMSLEYEERNIPALVIIDGKHCKAEISRYYTYGGAVYTMEITEL